MRKIMLVAAMGAFATVMLAGSAVAQETKASPKAKAKSQQTQEAKESAKPLQFRDLPAAVQQTVQDNLKGGTIKNIGKETEDGVAQYEIESVLNGKARDFNVDMKGSLLVMEEATTLDAIPAAAKAAILKKLGDGKLAAVETFSKPGRPMLYEAAYKDKAGTNHEILVKADGTETKG